MGFVFRHLSRPSREAPPEPSVVQLDSEKVEKTSNATQVQGSKALNAMQVNNAPAPSRSKPNVRRLSDFIQESDDRFIAAAREATAKRYFEVVKYLELGIQQGADESMLRPYREELNTLQTELHSYREGGIGETQLERDARAHASTKQEVNCIQLWLCQLVQCMPEPLPLQRDNQNAPVPMVRKKTEQEDASIADSSPGPIRYDTFKRERHAKAPACAKHT